MRPGAALPTWRLDTVDPERMRTMSRLLDDPNPIHVDPDAVRALGMGDRVVNQGPVNLAYVQNMLAEAAGGPERIRAVRVRFLANVFGGDAVEAGGRVTGVREAGGERLADCEVWLDVTGPGEARRALVGTATVAV